MHKHVAPLARNPCQGFPRFRAQLAATGGMCGQRRRRPLIADYRIYPDPSARGLDLSKLTALKLSISCIGFARQGAAQSPPKVVEEN